MLPPYAHLAGRRSPGRFSRNYTLRRLTPLCLILALGLALPPLPALAEEAPGRLLEFRGQIVLPPGTLSRGERISVALSATGSAFAAQKWADSKGRFKFRRLRPGTYSLSALIPGHGEILQTVEITRSFSDSKGRVEKKFRFDEETLQARARTVPQGLISLRELSIPSKALREYEGAEKRLERHDVERAIQHLEKAVALAPQFVEALNRLGTIYFQRKEFSKAESYFREALHQEPEAYAPLVNLGGALLAQKRSQEALEINLHAQNARPRDPLANAQLGLSYFLLGDYEQAVAYLQVTKEIDPAHFSQPQISLAEIHLRRSEDAAAVRELQDFLKYHPDSPEAEGVRATIREIQQSRSASPE